jgi:hypothetical protein
MHLSPAASHEPPYPRVSIWLGRRFGSPQTTPRRLLRVHSRSAYFGEDIDGAIRLIDRSLA